MNLAGVFLGLLLLGTGAAGFLLSAKVAELSRASADTAMGFAGAGGSGGSGGTAVAETNLTYVAVDTEPSSAAHRALSLGGIIVLVLAVAGASAWVIWQLGSMIVKAIFSQFDAT